MKRIRSIVRAKDFVLVLGFALACLVGFLYLWGKAGGTVPGFAGPSDYRVSFTTSDVKNLLPDGEVRIAGVKVGRVESTEIQADGRVRVELSMHDDVAPLHSGADVRVGVKSLVGSSMVEIVDGDGRAIPSGSSLPAASVTPAVDVDELLDTLDPPTRAALQSAVQRLARATAGRGVDLDRTMTGLGALSQQGGDALDALAAQSADLRTLSVESRQLLDALDEGRGQIATLVQEANTLTSATAAKQDSLRQTVQALPALMQVLKPAAEKLDALGTGITPLAASLRQAAPDLNQALVTLPSTTADLRGLVPSLDTTLDRTPATLDRIPALDDAVDGLVPQARTSLSDINPMLSYLKPYGLDLGVLFANFGGSFDTPKQDGVRTIRLTATAEGLATVRGNPLPWAQLLGPTGLHEWTNPYPAPGTVDQPQPFRGSYPHVTRDPR